MPTSEIEMIAWKWRSRLPKLLVAVHPERGVIKAVRNHESWKHA